MKKHKILIGHSGQGFGALDISPPVILCYSKIIFAGQQGRAGDFSPTDGWLLDPTYDNRKEAT